MRYSRKFHVSIFALGLGVTGMLFVGIGTGISLIWNLLMIGLPVGVTGILFLLMQLPFVRLLKQQ